MVKSRQILCRPLALGAVALTLVGSLTACGQRGPLFLPDGPEARQRATLPETLDPTRDTPPPLPSSATPGR